MIIKILELQLCISKQQGDACITKIVMRLSFYMQQRKLINIVRIVLEVILISDLVVTNKNGIKSFYREVLEDIGSLSALRWPSSVSNKSYMIIWDNFIHRISTSYGSLFTLMFWIHIVARHKMSIAFLSEDK